MSHSRLLDRVMVAGIVGLGLAAIVGLVVVPHLHGGHDASHDQPHARPAIEVPVTTVKAEIRTVERRVGVVGTLEGFEEISLSPKVEGRVARLFRDVGDVVAPNDKLADLDDIDFRLAVAEAERGLELELARLGLTSLNGKLEMDKVNMVARARNVEDNARSVLDRARRLGGGRGIGVEELEKIQTDYRVAQANRIQAELDAQTTLASARHRKAMLDTAMQKRADTHIVVPSLTPERLPPGLSADAVRFVVATRNVAEGVMVRANQTAMFRLVVDHPLKLVVTVPERHLGDVAVKQPVSLRVEAYPGQDFFGQVTRVNPTIDRINRAFTAEVLVDNAERRLRAGCFAKASVLVKRSERALCVPEEAVVRFAGEVKVFVVADGKSRGVPVIVGDPLPGAERWVEVIGALKAGDEVVTTGHSVLATGTSVRIRDKE